MLFNSPEFILLFLPAALIGYSLALSLGRRPSLAWLLLISLFFYGWWDYRYLTLLLLSITGNWLFARYLVAHRSGLLAALGVAANLGLLGYFKYAGFFAQIAREIGVGIPNFGEIVLPLAISFFTFQQISYLVDIQRGADLRPSWLEYALFVTLFPHLIAGPIVRHSELLPQFSIARMGFRSTDLAVGLTIFAIGLFKKVVMADSIAAYATPVFALASNGQPIDAATAWGGALAYTLQLYFDFSGYSDMAIGLARCFGFTLPLNFHSPYKADSIIVFWRRWHMSLSHFLRDYLYVPLGGNRVGPVWRHVNVMIVMLLGGLWHGAGWNFIIWGGLHGGFIVINHLWRGVMSKAGIRGEHPLYRSAAWLLTFACVIVAWVPFRADSLAAAKTMLLALAGRAHGSHAAWSPDQTAWLISGFAIVALLPNTHQFMSRVHATLEGLEKPSAFWQSVIWRPNAWCAIAIAVLLVLSLQRMGAPSEFLYFRF